MRPLPASTEDTSTQESQATPTDVNTTAGSGLHDANCCASDFDNVTATSLVCEDCRKIVAEWELYQMGVGAESVKRRLEDAIKIKNLSEAVLYLDQQLKMATGVIPQES